MGAWVDDLSNGQAALYKCTSEGNTPSRIYSMNPTDSLPSPLSSSLSVSPVTSASTTAGLLPDLDLPSTLLQYPFLAYGGVYRLKLFCPPQGSYSDIWGGKWAGSVLIVKSNFYNADLVFHSGFFRLILCMVMKTPHNLAR